MNKDLNKFVEDTVKAHLGEKQEVKSLKNHFYFNTSDKN